MKQNDLPVMTDRERIKTLLVKESEYLETHKDLYSECLSDKLLKDRYTDQEIKDGLILFYNVFLRIINNQ
jgi:hypothetical protein